jgi:homocysteine S-methyltransferase
MLNINPVTPFLSGNGTLILDGGLATELERRGHDLSDDLWSARLLADAPEVIRDVHLSYYRAGADCCTSASYQASVAGFVSHGLSAAHARRLIQRSVELVKEAREEFWAVESNRRGRLRPIVAASIGPYGAYLADGSEYTGAYDLDEVGLLDFHRERWQLLTQAGADILACETLPSFAEARALAQLLDETPDTFAWFSFTCRDSERISDGTLFSDCVSYLAGHDRVAAIGVNCTPPRFIPKLIRTASAITSKPIIVYPNSGETYDPVIKRWLGTADPAEFGTYSREWRKLGAGLIGGCCRTTPSHIRQISDRFRLPDRLGL